MCFWHCIRLEAHCTINTLKKLFPHQKAAETHPAHKQTLPTQWTKYLAHLSLKKTFGVSLGRIPLLCCNNVRTDATHFQNQSRMMDGVKSGNWREALQEEFLPDWIEKRLLFFPNYFYFFRNFSNFFSSFFSQRLKRTKYFVSLLQLQRGFTQAIKNRRLSLLACFFLHLPIRRTVGAFGMKPMHLQTPGKKTLLILKTKCFLRDLQSPTEPFVFPFIYLTQWTTCRGSEFKFFPTSSIPSTPPFDFLIACAQSGSLVISFNKEMCFNSSGLY